jgi:tetratricopeptide (TPR) repeat protein
MNVSKIAMVTGLLLGSTALAPLPAAAQYGSASQQAEEQAARGNQGQRQNRRNRGRQQQAEQPAAPQFTEAERAAILPLQTAVTAQDWAAATAALPAAQAAATTPQAKFLVGNFQFRIGEGTNNNQLRSQGVDAMLASGGAPPQNVQTLLGAQASFAINAQNWPVAEQALTRFLEGEAGNAERLRQLAEVKIRLNKYPEALALYQRLIQAGSANGQKAPQEQYQRALALARQVRNAEATAQISQAMITAYPTSENWATLLSAYRQESANNADVALDLRRLMFAAGAFTRDADYIEFADRLLRAGLLGEAKAVLDQGVSRGLLRSSDSTVRALSGSINSRIAGDREALDASRTRAMAASTGREARIAADNFLGYGRYADAANLYRTSLQKGGESADLLNLRLGIALALAGQRAEAETAFRAVTGSRTQLANYWLMWLARTAG